jgi:hypothetical protein
VDNDPNLFFVDADVSAALLVTNNLTQSAENSTNYQQCCESVSRAQNDFSKPCSAVSLMLWANIVYGGTIFTILRRCRRVSRAASDEQPDPVRGKLHKLPAMDEYRG